jgi:hypothetical protein
MPIIGRRLSRPQVALSVSLLMLAGPHASAQVQSPSERSAAPAAASLRTFPTPEDAVHGLIAAIAAPALDPLAQILGRKALESVPPEERQSSEVRRATGRHLASERFEISYEDQAHTRAVALFGSARVSLPAVLVKTSRGWRFDPEATVAAVSERRIGANEANAIRALRSFKRAQDTYRLSDVAGDGVLRYATRIRSTPGESDGLVAGPSEIVPGPPTDLLNDAFARAEGEPGDAALRPPGGYAYKVLKGQGPAAEGGAKSYLSDGRMSEGYAIVAWPTRPGETGLSTFIMNQNGVISEREFGARTADEVRKLVSYDPGPGWSRVAETEQ